MFFDPPSNLPFYVISKSTGRAFTVNDGNIELNKFTYSENQKFQFDSTKHLIFHKGLKLSTNSNNQLVLNEKGSEWLFTGDNIVESKKRIPITVVKNDNNLILKVTNDGESIDKSFCRIFS